MIFTSRERLLEYLQKDKTDFIVLAGFLWLVPDNILTFTGDRVVNIHPALLPLYGGRGMYGDKVHKEVISNHDKESGITIHYVNGQYDAGDIIFQARCKVEESETPVSLAAKVHALEYEYFPLVIENLLRKIDQRGLKSLEKTQYNCFYLFVPHPICVSDRFNRWRFNRKGINRRSVPVKPEIEVRTCGKSAAADISYNIPLFNI